MKNIGDLSKRLKDNYDGFFDFEIKESGLYLIIYSPKGNGNFVDIQEIIDRLNQKEIYQYNLDAIKKALEDIKSKEKIEVLISTETQLESIDEKVVVDIAKDKMFAVISFIPPQNNGKILTFEEVIKEIEDKGIKFGINKEKIEEALKERKANYKYIIAQGKNPIHGKDATLNFHFETQKEIKPKILEDGSVDFHDLDLIESVSKGQVLVTLIPPVEGKSGTNVLGIEIPPIKGKPTNLPKGKNTEISEDGLKLISTIDGQVNFNNNKVNVYETYEVSNNVDNSVGNIDFIGNVIVKGNVLTGFTITAGGNVEVYGVVEGARIEAQGDIILHRGIQGMNKGFLNSKGNIISKYIQNSTVEASGDIVSEAIMHSCVKCGGSIKVNNKKGMIVGGIIRASEQVDAKVIGSPMATVTEIEVGIDPVIVEKYRNLKEKLENIKREIIKTDQIIDLLNKMKEAGKITDDKKELLLKSIRTKIFLNNNLKSIKGELEEIEPLLDEKNNGKVKAYNIIYPGVKITIGKAGMYVREELKYCTLYKDRADIVTSTYE